MMPGPPPKDPKLRQRKNVEITATTFVESSPMVGDKPPPMPKLR